MIVKAKACSWGRGLATHLMKDENEHIELCEVRGFVSDNIAGAFREAEAVSKGTKCKNYLFSVSLSPPEEASCSPEDYKHAADRLEKRLGLDDQPRVIVIHEKEGRQHAHCVWSRINVATMTAPELEYYKNKCQDVSRDLFLHHNWKMPEGLLNSDKRDPLNYKLAEWQMAERNGENPEWLKEVVQSCWAKSDNRKGFENALEEKSLFLARGDKRGFVLVDFNGVVHALPRLLDLKAKDLKAKLGADPELRSVADTQKHIAKSLTKEARGKIESSRTKFLKRQAALASVRSEMVHLHRNERSKLAGVQSADWQKATLERQARLPRGLRGLWSWVIGETARIKTNNENEAKAQAARHAREGYWAARRTRGQYRLRPSPLCPPSRAGGKHRGGFLARGQRGV